ncbi:hypothetical protein CAEBREN_17265 [Caenorhabditis brenneri]|uniref:Uncharacterized protein n=1 Tax=Caenorhabditis brenneri TaxID=135651 RepID=G0NE90_CAEBE|nr:hypothetical protein CAEBREN_17265 [Caenorhabditis brenneri]
MSHVKIMDDSDKIRVKCMCSLVSQFIRLTQIEKWTKIVWNNARKDLVVTKGWKREADGWETEEEMMSLSQLKEKDDADETERERQKEINEIKESLRSLMRQERFTYLEREILNTFMDVPSFAVHIVSSSRNMETANTGFDAKRCALCNQRVGHRVLRHHETNECFVPYRYRMLYLCRMFEGEFKRCWICSTRIGNREHTCRLEPKECQRCKDNGFAGRMDHRQHTGVCQVLQHCHEQMNWLPTMEEMVEIMRDKQKVSWDWTEWLTSEERVIQEERAEKERRELEKGDVAKEKKSDEKVSAEVVATGQIESVTEDPSTEPSKDEGSVEESAKVMLIPKPPVIEMPGTADKPVVTTSKAVTKSSPNKVSANEKAVVQNAQMQSTHESPQPQKSLATFMEHFHQRNKKTQGSEKALQKPKENKEEFVSTNPDLDLEYLRRTGREDHKKMRMEQEKKEGRKKEGAKCQE